PQLLNGNPEPVWSRKGTDLGKIDAVGHQTYRTEDDRGSLRLDAQAERRGGRLNGSVGPIPDKEGFGDHATCYRHRPLGSRGPAQTLSEMAREAVERQEEPAAVFHGAEGQRLSIEGKRNGVGHSPGLTRSLYEERLQKVVVDTPGDPDTFQRLERSLQPVGPLAVHIAMHLDQRPVGERILPRFDRFVHKGDGNADADQVGQLLYMMVVHADTPGRRGRPDGPGLVGAVDAVPFKPEPEPTGATRFVWPGGNRLQALAVPIGRVVRRVMDLVDDGGRAQLRRVDRAADADGIGLDHDPVLV